MVVKLLKKTSPIPAPFIMKIKVLTLQQYLRIQERLFYCLIHDKTLGKIILAY